METDIPTGSSGSTASGSTTGIRSDFKSTSQSASSAPGGNMSGLRDDLSNLKSDLDALMSHASTLTEAELREARDRMMSRFSSARFSAKGMAEQASRQITQGRDITADYVRDKPLQSVAIAAGAGLLLGMIFRRD